VPKEETDEATKMMAKILEKATYKVNKVEENGNISELDVTIKAVDLINKLRALTTNNSDEAAFFVLDGVKYNIQVRIIKE